MALFRKSLALEEEISGSKNRHRWLRKWRQVALLERNIQKRWVRAGVHTTVALPYLSAYLGHAGLKNSQRYLRLTADLHPDISSRMDELYGALIPPPQATAEERP